MPGFTLTINASSDLLRRQLTDLQRIETPYAAARAATDVAFAARSEVQQEMRRIFKAPTQWTINSMVVDKANPKTDKPARVRFEEFSDKGTPAGRYLEPQMEGGARPPTPFERRLIASGFLRPGEFLVPARYAERDATGNLNPGQITKILSDLGTIREATKGSHPRDRGLRAAETYVLVDGGASTFYGRSVAELPAGIYLRGQKSFYLVFLIVRQPSYRAIFDFGGIVQRVVDRDYAMAFNRNLARAVQSSRYNPANSRQAA